MTVLLDDGTGTFPYDVSSYVSLSGITMTHGRADEQGDVQPSTMSLTFDNIDGRFTLGSTIIASPSPIQINNRIRVRLTVSATTVTRFTGYVQEWPVEWPSGGQEFSTVTITATDALARLGRIPTRLPVTERQLWCGATVVWPLTEPAPKSTPGMVAPVAWPVGPNAATVGPLRMVGKASGGDAQYPEFASEACPNDNGSVIKFVEALSNPYQLGKIFGGDTSTATGLGHPWSTNFQIEMAFKGTPGSGGNFMQVGDALQPSTQAVWFGSFNNDQLAVYHLVGGVTTSIVSAQSVMDNEWHLCTVIVDDSGISTELWLDGELVGTAMNPNIPTGTLDAVKSSNAIVGEVAIGHFAFYPHSANTNPSVWQSFGSAQGRATSATIPTYAQSAGVTSSSTGVPTRFIPVFNASDYATLMTEVVKADNGRLYVNGSGTVIHEGNTAKLTKVYAGTPDITVTVDALNSDASFSVDTQRMANRVEVTRAGGGSVVAEDASSIAQHGVYGTSETVQVLSDDDAANLAAYYLWLNKDPSTRLAGVKVDLLTQTTAIQQSFLINLMGAWLRFTGLPSQAPTGATADLYIEGWTEVITKTGWSLDLNTSPKRETATTWWRLNDANFPLGTNTALYY
ncbi:hypothetical protein [Nocardioides sp. WS12]|uniref:hypothetical protein n=1 Tax=Nocardioides sp. WS12 TaxID=2486272 RepID=UPI0015FE279D|nr:hypothetical protein [Nocardioides sp. WS12]